MTKIHKSPSQSFNNVFENEKFKIFRFNRMFKIHTNYMHTCMWVHTHTRHMHVCTYTWCVVSHDFILFLNCGKIPLT